MFILFLLLSTLKNFESKIAAFRPRLCKIYNRSKLIPKKMDIQLE
jgi:hypothetical protein